MDVNVKVAVRCRPLSEKGSADDGSAGDKTSDYTFDACYDLESRQEQVYTDLGRPIVLNALDGYNSTVFAYGQTGSGKTHTMMGYDGDPGLVPRLNLDLFTSLKEKLQKVNQTGADGSASGQTKFLITIYNEVIRDLLNPSDKKLNIRENPKSGIYVDGLCELVVRDSNDVSRLLEQGSSVRRVAATNMNEQSSRSHSCFTIKIEQKTTTELQGGRTREQLVRAKLNLVDLAGSERADKTGAQGATLKEGANINMSLMALGNVINALAEGAKSKKHIPYRDSKLTRLLQESLGGNSQTVMIAAISPADYNHDETISTLKYANRAKSIENAVSRNEDVNERAIRELKEEIDRLRQQLTQDAKVGTVDPELERQLEEMQQAQKNAWDEKEQLSRALEEERNANMNAVISSVIDGVKEQKVSHLKAIKRLNLEKGDLVQKEKVLKEKNAVLKKTLDDDMKSYGVLQVQYEELRSTGASTDEISAKMQALLQKIEGDRKKWTDRREYIKKARDRLKTIEEKMTEERAELVATAGILDQNDRLRMKIQEEERMKARESIELEIGEAKAKLEKERESVRGSLEADFQYRIDEAETRAREYKAQLDLSLKDNLRLQKEIAELLNKIQATEDRLAETEAACDVAESDAASLAGEKATLQGLLEEMQDKADKKDAEHAELMAELRREAKARVDAVTAAGKAAMEEEKLRLFGSLMDSYDVERTELLQALERFKALLQEATRDVAYLTRENAELRDRYSKTVLWEAPIVPTRARATRAAGEAYTGVLPSLNHGGTVTGGGTFHGGATLSPANSASTSHETSSLDSPPVNRTTKMSMSSGKDPPVSPGRRPSGGASDGSPKKSVANDKSPVKGSLSGSSFMNSLANTFTRFPPAPR